eukprot:TRINITY_DN667_c0_g1_i1.p1 TRINITY_DN667_c0_g1~~TRINITY_DN667_c0_g1_i1.p1  ORF type:complete len:355 (-),score=89.96 TRINITY_DN667_c0_g1_i1:56-1120(-)
MSISLTLQDIEEGSKQDLSTLDLDALTKLAKTYGLTDEPISVVQLDGLVVVKIIKHCVENLHEIVTGTLLGLDVGTTLEVTNCFPLPLIHDTNSESSGLESAIDEDKGNNSGSTEDYQTEMMRCMRDVDVDWSTVGWYTSSYLGSIPDSLITYQYNYQSSLKKAVVVLFDPIKLSRGEVSLKAMRLSPKFMKLYDDPQNFTTLKLSALKLGFENIFETVPIEISNSELVNSFLNDLATRSALNEFGWGEERSDFERLVLSTNPFLEQNLEFLIESVDELAVEQRQLQYYQRKRLQKRKELQQQGKAEEKDQPISHLDSLLLSGQINVYCKQMKEFAGESFEKLWVLNAVNKAGK